MPISLDEAFAGALGVQLGVGNDLQDQFNRMSRALERSGDPLADIGFEVFTVIRDLASTLQAPPLHVMPVRVVNLGMLELMAVGSYAFLVLIFLKLLRLCRQIGGVSVSLNRMNAQLTLANAYLAALLNCVCGRIAGMFAVVIGLFQSLIAHVASLSVAILISTKSEHKFIFDIGPNLKDLDFLALLALIVGLATFGLPAAVALVGLALGLALAAGAIWLVAKALQQMPANSKELIDSLGWLAVGLLFVAAVAGIVASRGKALLAVVLGLGTLWLFLMGVAWALSLMPSNTKEIVEGLRELFIALGLMSIFLAALSPERFKQVALGFLAIGAFVLALGGAIALMDKETLDALPGLQTLFDGIIALAEKIEELAGTEGMLQKVGLAFLGIVVFVGLLGAVLKLFDAETLSALPGIEALFTSIMNLADAITGFSPEQLWTIAAGFAGIVLFVGLLGLAMKLFDAETLSALPGLQALLDTIINLANAITGFSPEQLWTIAAGFAGIVLFVGLLGLALWFFGDSIAQAAAPMAMLIGSVTALASVFANFDAGQLFVLGIGLALLAGFVWAIAAAAVFAGPNLNSLAAAISALNTLLNTAASAAGSVAEAIRSIPSSIPLPSLPSLPLVGSRQTGGPIDETGNYLLHEGEFVLNAAQVDALESGRVPAGGSTSVSVGAVNVSLNAQSVDQESIGPLSEQIVAQIQAQLRELAVDQRFRSGERVEVG